MKLHNEDCIIQMQKMIDEGVQVDSVVTDPPYELGFMGKSWDSTGIAFQKETWELAFELLKPGGHLLAFSGSRTYRRMAVAIEDAGFEIRDQIMWLYGSGFPKSMNIGKNIDKINRGVRHGTKDNSSEMHGVKREKIEVAGIGNMTTTCSVPSKFTFPYSENMIVIEVASEKSHQSVKKYCDQTQRDVTRKGFTLSNLLSLSILDQLK